MSEDKYSAVPLAKVNPDSELPIDIYVSINDKYLKFKEKGDFIPAEKLNFFVSKNVAHLFVSEEDFGSFQDWVEASKKEIIDDIVEEVGEENRKIVEVQEDLREKVYDTFFEEELSSDTVHMLKGTIENFIETVKDANPAKEVLAKLLKISPSVVEHSVNTANVSIYLAMCLGHGHHFVLENIYMGAVLHDYGKAKIDPELLEQPQSPKYSQAIQDHPIKGYKMAKKIPNVNEQILTIISQHHEQHNGKGFPKGIAGDEIYELAKIVSIANKFNNALEENSNRKSEMYKVAIKVIEYDRGKEFDPELLPRVVDGLKLAYGNYHRDRKD